MNDLYTNLPDIATFTSSTGRGLDKILARLIEDLAACDVSALYEEKK